MSACVESPFAMIVTHPATADSAEGNETARHVETEIVDVDRP
jgi:hypothetical protein